MSRGLRILAVLGCMLSALLSGCVTLESYRQGRELAAEGRIEDSLEKFQQAMRAEPNNAEYRAAYLTTRERAIAGWLAIAERARAAGQAAQAEQLIRRVLALEQSHPRALAALEELQRDKRHAVLLSQASAAWKKNDETAALGRLREILIENPRHRAAAELKREIEAKTTKAPGDPVLDAALRKQISIEFRDTPLRQVMEVFSRTSGVNFVFDRDVRPDLRATVFLRNTTVRDAMAMVLLTNQLEHRVLDAHTIVIYPNTPAKAREYQPLTVRTFFLDHGDVKAVATTLRTIVKTRDLIVDEKQNMIIMRDTPEAVRLAEKLVSLHDLPEPEVMLEVEILEIKRTRLLELGVQWPSQLSLTPLSTTGGTTLTLEDLRNITDRTTGAAINPLVVNLRKQDSDVNLLANPRIRAKNREKARVLVGERVPNITTTATSTGFISESVTYIDVGLKLEVEPAVAMNDEISIKVGLEVSSIVQQIQTRSGSLAFQIGTRNASTALRLKDGENQVLAGLINDEERNSGNKVPALGDIPIIGRLFGSQRDEGSKTEIVLSITPRIVRNPVRPSLAETQFDAGTEASLRNRGLTGPVPGAGPLSVRPGPGFTPVPKPQIKPPVPGAPAGTPGASTGPGASTPTPGGAGPIVGVPGGGVAGTPTGPTPFVTAGATTFAIQGPAQAQVGASFDVVLSVQPDQPITSIPFTIGYDPKLIEIQTVTEGEFMRQGGAATTFTNNIDAATGRVSGTVTRGSSDGASQSGTVLTLRARAVAANTTATVQMFAISAIGVGARSIAIQAPSAYRVAITPAP